MIVVDTNVIAYLHLAGPLSPRASRVLAKDPVWASPLLWRSEFRNVLVTSFRRGILDLREALDYAEEADSFLSPHTYSIQADAVLSVASDSGLSAYDAEYVALAQELGVRLVTESRMILEEFPDVAVSMEDFLAS